MGLDRLTPGQVVDDGAVWKVSYDQTPPVVERLDLGNFKDFHPLGLAFDLNPTSKEEKILTVNLQRKNAPAIEVFKVEGQKLVHLRTIRDPALYNPNHIHLMQNEAFRAEDGTPSFFVSNDHYFKNKWIKKVETYLLPWSSVHFYNARTNRIERVINGLSFANGVAGTDNMLFVSETSAAHVRQYKINKGIRKGEPYVYLDYVTKVKVSGAPDNLRYNPDKELLLIAVHPKPIELFKRIATHPLESPPLASSQIEVWDLSTDETRVIFQDQGHLLCSSSSAVFDSKASKLLVSGVYADGLIVCDL